MRTSKGFKVTDKPPSCLKADKGNSLHEEILSYLEDKVIKEGDIDF